MNSFLNCYENRYKYKLLNQEDFKECFELVNRWEESKEKSQINMDNEFNEEVCSIKEIFENYDKLNDKVKVAGIYIDNKLEAFTIGEKINEDTALIHIEKANSNIRGLYQYINQQFLLNEFPNIKYVNREEDLGVEGLRKAKISYHQYEFVEKYSIKEL